MELALIQGALRYHNLPTTEQGLLDMWEAMQVGSGPPISPKTYNFLTQYFNTDAFVEVGDRVLSIVEDRVYQLTHESDYRWEMAIDNDSLLDIVEVREAIYQYRISQGKYQCSLEGQCLPTDRDGLSLEQCKETCESIDYSLIPDNLYQVYAFTPELALNLPVKDKSRILKEIIGYSVPDPVVSIALEALASQDWFKITRIQALNNYLIGKYGVEGIFSRDLIHELGLYVEDFNLERINKKVVDVIRKADLMSFINRDNGSVDPGAEEFTEFVRELKEVFYWKSVDGDDVDIGWVVMRRGGLLLDILEGE